MHTLPEQIRGWIGRPVIIIDHVVTVERGLWINFCAAIEDANPLYWSYAQARDHTDSVIAPPTMLPGWAIAPEWEPDRTGPPPRTLELHFMVKDALGLPHGLVKEVDLTLHEPLRAGDSVRAEQILRSVGDERLTRLGPGRDWTIDIRFTRPDGRSAGVQTLHMLGYRKGETR